MNINKLVLSVSLFLCQVSIAQDSLTKANQILDNVRKDLTAMSADFEQYETDANERMSEKSTGKMWLNFPNQFKWEYLSPAPQLIVANGEQVWIYDEDLDQVTIKRQQSTQNPIYILLNKQETEKNYTLEFLASDGTIQWISMLPKVPSDEIKQVWLGIVDDKIRVLKLKNQLDNIVAFEFDNIKKNPQLTDDFFTFTPPEGVDVISDNDINGAF